MYLGLSRHRSRQCLGAIGKSSSESAKMYLELSNSGQTLDLSVHLPRRFLRCLVKNGALGAGEPSALSISPMFAACGRGGRRRPRESQRPLSRGLLAGRRPAAAETDAEAGRARLNSEAKSFGDKTNDVETMQEGENDRVVE